MIITCCGSEMHVVEYDSDEDAYHYVCAENPSTCPARWFTDDDETWK